jgi:hypothetical protein
MWIFYASVAVLGFVLSMFISRQYLSTVHVETRTGLEKAAEGSPNGSPNPEVMGSHEA